MLTKRKKKNKKVKLAQEINPQEMNNVHLDPANVKVLDEVIYAVMSRDARPEAFAIRNLFNPHSRKLHYIKFSDFSKILIGEFEAITDDENDFFFDEKLFNEMVRTVEDDYKRAFNNPD